MAGISGYFISDFKTCSSHWSAEASRLDSRGEDRWRWEVDEHWVGKVGVFSHAEHRDRRPVGLKFPEKINGNPDLVR